MGKKAYKVVVQGSVTGVCFRYYTCREVDNFSSISGWVRNADHRTVECFFQGDEKECLIFAEWLRHGPSSARVVDYTCVDTTIDPTITTFTVRY